MILYINVYYISLKNADRSLNDSVLDLYLIIFYMFLLVISDLGYHPWNIRR